MNIKEKYLKNETIRSVLKVLYEKDLCVFIYDPYERMSLYGTKTFLPFELGINSDDLFVKCPENEEFKNIMKEMDKEWMKQEDEKKQKQEQERDQRMSIHKNMVIEAFLAAGINVERKEDVIISTPISTPISPPSAPPLEEECTTNIEPSNLVEEEGIQEDGVNGTPLIHLSVSTNYETIEPEQPAQPRQPEQPGCTQQSSKLQIFA